MEDLTDVYNELIMEHSMNSYNKKKLDNADYSQIGHNPNCGDEITLELKLNGNIIEEIIKTFIAMIKRETTNEEELKKLEDAIAFRNVANMPARVKCALLAWHTIEDILENK